MTGAQPNVAANRRRVLRRLTSEVVIEIPGGESYWDPVTEQMVAAPPQVLYEGPASVRTAGQDGRVVDAAGQLVVVRGYVVQLPGDVGVRLDHGARVIITACQHTPALVGTELAIVEAPQGEHQAVRRLLCSLNAA